MISNRIGRFWLLTSIYISCRQRVLILKRQKFMKRNHAIARVISLLQQQFCLSYYSELNATQNMHVHKKYMKFWFTKIYHCETWLTILMPIFPVTGWALNSSYCGSYAQNKGHMSFVHVSCWPVPNVIKWYDCISLKVSGSEKGDKIIN